MNTLEFAQSALKILRDVPEDKFNIDACGANKSCGCAMHWMFYWGVLPTESRVDGSPYWDTSTAAHRLYHLEGSEDDKEQLRVILGFKAATDAWYDVEDSRDITKNMVMQQLEEFIHAH